MAVQLLLAKRTDLSAVGAEISTLNLLTGAGLNIEYMDGWQAAIAAGNPPDASPVTDVLNLVVTGTTGDTLATYLRNLDHKVRQVQEFWEGPQEPGGVWLRAQLTSETKARQAFIREAALSLGESIFTPYTDASSVIRKLALSLVRQPFWEATTPENTSVITNCLGGTLAATPFLVTGDVPARVPYLSASAIGGVTLREWWLGFRSTRYGTLANFVPSWDLGLAAITRGTDTIQQGGVGDATGGGNVSRCNFATDATLVMRARAMLSTITANAADQRGRFHVLLRAKVTDNTTVCHVQMADGYNAAASFRTQQGYQVIDGAVTTSWYLYPVGTITIPPTRVYSGSPNFTTYAIAINASRASGAGSLDMDCLILIPHNEGAIHGEAPAVATNCAFYTRENETVDGYTTSAVSPVDGMGVDCQNWGCPINTVMWVFAAQRATSQVSTDTATVAMYRYHRWRTLRGAD